MDLILTVVADPQGANMRNHTKVFDRGGGSFGRADDNTWVLPDPERVISSYHATIQFEGGSYYLVDSSTNGTFVNDAPTAIQSGSKQVLADGDVLGVGDYRLKVSMRVPEIKTDLPKGLAPVDFFDESDKTRMSEANLENMQSGAADFDHLLDHNAAQAPKDDQWGYFSDSEHAEHAEKSPGDNSFLSGLRHTGEPSAAQLDPLAGLGGGGDRSEIAWDSDEDWWRSESEADNVPLDRHAIDVKPKMPSPPIQPKRKPPLPEPVAPPQKPAEDNPFEASAALVQGELSDTSEILDSVGASSDAARSAFPQIPATPPAEVPQMPHVPLEPKPADPVPPQVAQTPPQQPLFPGISNTGPARAGVAAEPGSAHHTADLQNVKALAQSLGLGNMEEQQLQQLLPEAGAIIEECISRLMDLMRARASVKNELRVAQTMIQLQDNNPLKFSVTPQDAILAMFGNSNSAYMSPTEAVKDSFNDLSDHQMAVLSGMRAAYEYMLRQFSPKMLERRLNIKSSHVILSKNAKKWEAYEKLFESLQKDPENTYHRFFGDEFSSAYEEQLGKLKNSRQLKRRDS